MILVNWYDWRLFFILILIMEESAINWLDLDEKGYLWPIGLVLTKERLRSTGLILTKGCLRSTGLILTKGTSAINWFDCEKRVFAINWLDLDKKERLDPTSLVLTKGRLRSTGLILTKRSVCDQLAWSWQKGAFAINCLNLWQKGVSTTN